VRYRRENGGVLPSGKVGEAMVERRQPAAVATGETEKVGVGHLAVPDQPGRIHPPGLGRRDIIDPRFVTGTAAALLDTLTNPNSVTGAVAHPWRWAPANHRRAAL